MNPFRAFRRVSSAPVACQRLRTLLEYERRASRQTDPIGLLQDDIVTLVSRYVTVAPEKVRVTFDRGVMVSRLAIDIELPNGLRAGLP